MRKTLCAGLTLALILISAGCGEDTVTAGKADEWNAFVAKSKNGTFLFDRRYMDYHADRFSDHSLMCYHDGKLFAFLAKAPEQININL